MQAGGTVPSEPDGSRGRTTGDQGAGNAHAPWEVRRVDETGSTNADLLELARAGAPEGIALVADHQTAGRGRLGRAWIAPPGASLLLSLLFRPAGLEPARLHLVTAAVALAASDACAQVAGVRPELKWPNDLMLGGRKLAGILAESVVAHGHVDAVVVGIGLNVNWPAEVPEEVAGVAVALNHVSGAPVDRDALLDALLRALARPDWSAVAARYRASLATVGQLVRVELASGELIGDAVDVTDEGHLVVQAGGRRHDVTAGDVVHLRALS